MLFFKENGFISHDEELQIECKKLEKERKKLLEDIENLKHKKSSFTGKGIYIHLSLIL